MATTNEVTAKLRDAMERYEKAAVKLGRIEQYNNLAPNVDAAALERAETELDLARDEFWKLLTGLTELHKAASTLVTGMEMVLGRTI